MSFFKSSIMMGVQWCLTKKIAAIVLIAGLAAGSFLTYRALGQKALPTYQTAKVERGMIVSTVTASGQILDSNIVNVTTQATGVVKELFVKDGDQVQAGDNLLTIELDSNGQLAREKAWAAYLSAKIDLDSAKQNAVSLSKDVKAAEIELETAKQSKLGLERELKLAEASLATAQNAWDAIQAGSAAGTADRKQKELALQAAQHALTLAQSKYANADKAIERAELDLSLALKNTDINTLSSDRDVKAAEIELENARQSELELEKQLRLAETALTEAYQAWEASLSDPGASEADRLEKELAVYAAQDALDLAQRKYDNAKELVEKAELSLSLAEKRAEQNTQSSDKDVKAAENGLETAKQSKLALERELKLAEASLAAAQYAWEAIQEGSGAGNADRKQKELALQAAQVALALAQNKYDSADDSIQKAELNLSLTKHRAENSSDAVNKATANMAVARAAYEATLPVVTAPVSGIISDLNVVVGTAVNGSSSSAGGSSGTGGSNEGASASQGSASGQKIAAILVGNLPLASFNVSEIDVARVRVGQKATITVDALPGKTFTGKVVGINRTGVVNSGVCSYPVTLQFDTPSDESLPNMAANASIITDSKDNVLLLPVNAVKTVRGETVVTVLRNGEENQLPVVVGLSSDTRVEIVSGLGEGDEVVVNILSGDQQSAGSPFSGGFSGGALRPGGLSGGGFTGRPSR